MAGGGGGGGKGGQQQQQTKTELPPEILAAAKQNMGMADEASKIGQVLYQGNTQAAFSPAQLAAMQNTGNAMSTFGLSNGQSQAQAAGVDPYTGLAMSPTLQGGVLGFSPMGQFNAAKAAVPAAQRGLIDSFVMNPQTGAAPASPLVTPTALYGGQNAAAAAPVKKAALTPAQIRANAEEINRKMGRNADGQKITRTGRADR